MAIHNGYVGARTCTSGPTTGARGGMAWFMAKYADDGGLNAGIYNCRSIRGGTTTSLHGEGRAFDAAIRPYSARYGTELADLIRRHSKELGVQCVIWNRKIWSGYYDNWRSYSGTNPHVDHLHIELTWAAANRSQAETVALWEKTLGHLVDDDSAVPVGNVKPKPKPKPKPKNSGTKRNYSDEQVNNIIAALNRAGYDAGPEDADYGDRVKSACKTYQRAQQYPKGGLEPDGDWGPVCIAHYGWAKKLQDALNDWAAVKPDLTIDGDVRGKTIRAVGQAQDGSDGRGTPQAAYRAAGGVYVDRDPGPITCKMLGVPRHPSDK